MLMYSPTLVKPQGYSTPFFQANLPLPPSVNNAHIPSTKYVNGRRVSTIIPTPELVAFKQSAAYLLPSSSWIEDALLNAIRISKVKTPLSVHFNFYLVKRWTSGDVDNRIKYAQDVCFAYLGLNDNMVDCVSARRYLDVENPRCEVEISCYTA